jgi:RNA polymerase sigma factor (sigma-70 family)
MADDRETREQLDLPGGDSGSEGGSAQSAHPSPTGSLVAAWAEALDLQERRAIEARIAEALADVLAKGARAALQRMRRGDGRPSVEDVVHQAVIELPTILSSFLETSGGRNPGERGSLESYARVTAQNIAFDLQSRRQRERELLQRHAAAHPSHYGRMPTTPSQRVMRSEIGELLDAELENLAEMDREILLRRREKQSFARIGADLGLPAETARDRFHACAERLCRVVRRALGGDPFGEGREAR